MAFPSSTCSSGSSSSSQPSPMDRSSISQTATAEKSEEASSLMSLPDNSILMPSDEGEECLVPWPTTGSSIVDASPLSTHFSTHVVPMDPEEIDSNVSMHRNNDSQSVSSVDGHNRRSSDTTDHDGEATTAAAPDCNQLLMDFSAYRLMPSRDKEDFANSSVPPVPRRRSPPVEEDQPGTLRSPKRPEGKSTVPIEPGAPLSWRMDPSHSLADWRLEIFNRSTKQFETYHVHRLVLCVGARACGYFAHALHRDTHRIPLIAKACELVPQLLDYVYQLPTFRLTTDNAVGMAFLAHLFQQPKLIQETMEFVYRDLCASHLYQYLREATYYDQNELVDWIVQLGSKEMLTMDSHQLATFLEELSPTQFVKLLQYATPSNTETSWSTLLVEFCIYHRHEVSMVFLETCSPHIPALTSEAAIALLELTLTISEGQGTSIQRKCLEYLAEHWHQIDDFSILEQLVDIHPDLALEWFPQVLKDASHELRFTRDELRQAWAQEATAQDELRVTKSQLDQAQREIDHLTKTLESTKIELRSQLHGLMKKRSVDRLEQRASVENWNQERRLWKQERRKWLEERSALEEELCLLKNPRGVRRKRETNRNKLDVCQAVETQEIFNYLSTMGMGDVDADISSDTSFDLSST